jgi:Na+-driven multidrug efflux pump
MLMYVLSVMINIILAPILIAGWGTGSPLGVSGAGLATSISVLCGIVLVGACFRWGQNSITLDARLIAPRITSWRSILYIGLPAGTEFTVTFLSTAVAYYSLRDLGNAAQAGFGVGWRVLQIMMWPAMCIAIAAIPIVGQSFGARDFERVREIFRKTAAIGAALMIFMTCIVQLGGNALVGFLNADKSASVAATVFLRLTSWSLVAQGVVYACSTMFQGLGSTAPSLISSVIRLVLFAGPAVWLSTRLTFRPNHMWYLTVACVALD